MHKWNKYLMIASFLIVTFGCNQNTEKNTDIPYKNENENPPKLELPIGTWVWDSKPQIAGRDQTGYIQFLSSGHVVYSWNTLYDGLVDMKRYNHNDIIFAVFGLWEDRDRVFHFTPTSYIKAFFGDGEELRKFQTDIINRKDIRTYALDFSIYEMDESVAIPFETAEIIDQENEILSIQGIGYPRTREESLPFIKYYRFNDPEYLEDLAELMNANFQNQDSSDEFIERFLELYNGRFR
jgi:hypothetical protein